MDKAEQPTITLADELLREIFLHGHSEGWTGNQTRRDVQHVDAEKGWSLYVSNGALEKTKARHRTTSLAAQDGLVEALEWISKICDEEIPLEYNDAMRKAFQRNIRDAANKALSAIKEQHHD